MRQEATNKNLFSGVRAAVVNEVQRLGQNRRQRNQHGLLSRAQQAAIFAEEEAQLHEQLMIEQIIIETQQEREPEATREMEDTKSSEDVIEATRTAAVHVVENNKAAAFNAAEHHDAVLNRMAAKREAVERKLDLIRKQIMMAAALPSKNKVDNSDGIAALRAALMA